MQEDSDRPATVGDVHELALAMPDVVLDGRDPGRADYKVGGASFVLFREPRGDAVDPTTGERYDDVLVLRVADESDKAALVQDPRTPFFTTPHFDGYPALLVRTSRIGELTVAELTEHVQESWLAVASVRRRSAWLAADRP